MKKIKLFALALTALFSLSAIAEETVLFSSFASTTKDDYFKDYTVDSKTVNLATDKTISSSSGDYFISLASTPSNNASNYVELSVSDATIKSVSILITGNGSDKTCQPALLGWTGAIADNTSADYALVPEGVVVSNKGLANAAWHQFAVNGNSLTKVRIYRAVKGVNVGGESTSKTTFGNGQSLQFYGIRVELEPTCEAPGTPLALVITPSANLTAGDIVTISTEGGNGNPVSFTLDGNTYSDGPTWTAVAGTHTFAVSQDENAGVCGGDDEVILNVASTSPVTSATVEGSNIGFIGQELTYTVTAENATTYAWYVDGVAQAETSATFVYTAAAGDHTIYATATNAYTSDPVQSNTIALTVTKPCGEIIKATLTDGVTAVVTGVIGGTADANLTKSNRKMDKGKYFGITLASGTFLPGDTVNINIESAQQLMCLFGDKEKTQLLFLGEDAGQQGDNFIVLPAAAAGLSSLYIARDADDATYKWNPVVNFISVTRPCAASNNANIDKVWFQMGEEILYFNPEADGLTYNIVVPASVPLTEADLQFSLAHPMATSDVVSPIHFTIPAAGDPAVSQTIVVTAEDGTTQKTYTINVSKSAEADHDATLSSLAVTGYTLVPAFDPAVINYTITKAYGSANPGTDKIVLERASSVSSSTKEAVGDDLVITVTAEDGTTQVVYTIHIAEAAADKDLLEVAFSNGAKGDIDAANFIITVPYLTGEAAPTYVSAQFASWVEGASAEMVGNDLQVTGADGQTALYTINAVEMFPAPVVVNSDVVFDGSEVYIHAHYGWDSGKGWKMAKYTEEKGNRRISSGNNRMYIALPAAKSVFLTSGSGGAREATITVNGVVSSITKLAGSNAAIQLGLSDTHANFIEVINKGNGDGGFISMQLSDQPTQLGEAKAEDAVKAHKEIRNGQIIIVRGDKEFDLTGAPLN